MQTTIRPYDPADHHVITHLVAAFRVALAALRGHNREPDIAAAAAELQEYIDKAYPIFIAYAGRPIGYLVCRIDADTVWVESLYVSPRFRRRGIAAKLYSEAEKIAQSHNQATLYNWVHPNNHRMIAFLKKQGYDVLNLIEIRKRRPEEKAKTTIRVGSHTYAY